ncbi:MAG: hypothetical protein IJ251_04845 [Oscillospiraceae bacterium]|nr:hypothetical protein [Oscillospiraceae bacterium]
MSGLKVNSYFGDHMIIQGGMPISVYGTASEGKVTVGLTGAGTKQTASAVVKDGRWEVVFPPISPSYDTYEIHISDGSTEYGFSDVLVGEVFHISGQSNMELPICRTVDPFEPHYPAEDGYIREYRVPVTPRFDGSESDEPGGKWEKSEGDALYQMSGAGHYFAQEIRARLDVPVGLINTAAGGAPVEARLSLDMLRSYGGYDAFLDECTKEGYIENTVAADRKKYVEWVSGMDTSLSDMTDTPFEGECNIPFHFSEREDLWGISGRVWFRRKLTIPDNATFDDALLSLGVMTDADEVYVNGVKVGETGYMYPPRRYPVPADILRHGENEVCIRLEVRTGNGGFTEGKRYCLRLGETIIDLSGKWEYHVAHKAPDLVPDVFFQGLPLSLYTMTSPVLRIPCAGLIWYQAESNGDNADRYPFLFGEFVKMYRRRCGRDIPVIFAQLPNFADVKPGSWAALREAQRKCLDIPGTAMTVNIDIGESHDLHPINKWDVGKRLAYAALRLIYGNDDVPRSAYPVSAVKDDCGITIRMSCPVTAEDPQKFTVSDGTQTCPAKAEVDGDTIRLTYGGISPVTVRYLYEDDPDRAELFCDGLPVTPFEMEITG